ncbi:aconitase family protein [Rhodoferax ferrireducens]|uniref:aconitase family protein n=1 Tax=Rhodoferax ferrireducens TaxID=192843 RepID=UPI000E0CF60C|nr:aconitase family protein [Rhodoferax ferrireducens]
MTSNATRLTLPGRLLLLCRDPARINLQLQGTKLSRLEAGPLRDDISTDEITPVAILSHYDDALGRYPYTGFRADGQSPIGVNAVRDGGFSVVVAGQRYGKGSSREHSPAAEKLAGIRLVIAASFERIYRQNADNIGLFTSTDFGLVERIQRGEAIAVDELVAGRDALAAAILKSGGLLRFGQLHMGTVRSTVPAAPARALPEPQPQTLFEKIIARHALPTALTEAQPPAGAGFHLPGAGMFVRADWRFIHEYYTGMCAHMLHTTFGRPLVLHGPASIIVFEDHTSYVASSPAHLRAGLVPNVRTMCQAQRDFAHDYGLRFHRTLTDEEAALDDGSNVAGISHAMMAEHYALPGQLVVGTDSHTPHSGALGCVAFGVGTTDMANAFVTGAVRLTVPASLRIELLGPIAPGITAKDIVLHLLAAPDIRAGLGVGKVFEFGGSALAHLSIDERATLTNMTAELGGLTGIVAPDAQTQVFLRERRGVDFEIEPWMHSDPDAHYAGYITLDCAALSPMVAAPGDPGNGVALSQLDVPVKIDIAYGGSCTAGKRGDFAHYHAVLAWGLQHGLRVPSGVKLYLQYGTTAVRDYCIAQGYDKTFAAVGAQILQPSCGACANCGPGSSTEADQVTVSAINRNFPGRSGPGQVWLASPPTVMASALAGELISFAGLQARVAVQVD